MRIRGTFVWMPILFAIVAGGWRQAPAAVSGSCFLLLDAANGTVVRDPDAICEARVPPASTFKIPHAIAALDSGVVKGVDDVIAYDGSPRDYESWRHDHTLASAMRFSVVSYSRKSQSGWEWSARSFTCVVLGTATPIRPAG